MLHLSEPTYRLAAATSRAVCADRQGEPAWRRLVEHLLCVVYLASARNSLSQSLAEPAGTHEGSQPQ
eukprot:2831708-Prymnesium_polylepis.1